MKRAEILQTATNYVTKDRAAEHGDAERNFETIANLWQVYLESNLSRCRVDQEMRVVAIEVTPSDVAAMMMLLKIARLGNNPANVDNWVDAAGYAACGGELATAGTPVQRVVLGAFTTMPTLAYDVASAQVPFQPEK